MIAQNDIGPTTVESTRDVMLNQSGLGIDYLLENDSTVRAQMLANRGALEYEEWKELTDTVVEVRKQQLNLVSDLREAGLTRQADIAQLVTKWQTSDHISEDAEISVEYGHRSDEETVSFGLDGAPLPLYQKYWRIDRRFLENSRRGPGGPLNTRLAAQMTRAVSNTIEYSFLQGWNRPIDGYQMYGLMNHPKRNEHTGGDWTTTSDPQDVVRDDILDMIEMLEDDEFDDGGYWLYLSRSEWQRLRALIADFGGGNPGDVNMRDRIREEFSEEIDRVRVTKNIPDGEAVMFQPSRDVVEVGMAEDIQPVEWESADSSTVYVKIMAAMNIQLASTAEGQMGVVHATGLQG